MWISWHSQHRFATEHESLRSSPCEQLIQGKPTPRHPHSAGFQKPSAFPSSFSLCAFKRRRCPSPSQPTATNRKGRVSHCSRTRLEGEADEAESAWHRDAIESENEQHRCAAGVGECSFLPSIVVSMIIFAVEHSTAQSDRSLEDELLHCASSSVDNGTG